MPAHMTLKKPAKGSAAKARRAARAAIERRERAAKLAAKERDGWRCQYPGCGYQGKDVHAMHINHAGMGGDPSGARSSQRAHYITGCAAHHTGRRSWHSGHVTVIVGQLGGDGPVSWYRRDRVGDEWSLFGLSE